MNANELADELMKFYNLEENTAPIQIYDLAATMLRQQQAEIEALKAEKDQAFKDGYSMGQYATLNIR